MTGRVAKMHGAANDFVVLEGAPPGEPAGLVQALCDRRRGLGADGALWMERDSGGVRFRMHFFNADGGRANLCLNGARCLVRRARELGWVEEGERFAFRTERSRLEGRWQGGLATLWLRATLAATPVEPGPGLPGRVLGAWQVDTGDPHLVIELAGVALDALPFEDIARPLRAANKERPHGANVHIVVADSGGRARIRSFERGVEAETHACGSGCLAATVARGGGRLALRTHGGDTISVGRDGEVWTLDGPATTVYELERFMPRHGPVA